MKSYNSSFNLSCMEIIEKYNIKISTMSTACVTNTANPSSIRNLSNAHLIIYKKINRNNYLPNMKNPIICSLINTLQSHMKSITPFILYVHWT
jgi:hypothetical protein